MLNRLDCLMQIDSNHSGLVTLGLLHRMQAPSEPINVLLVGFGAVGVICSLMLS